jgi:hypothetical protein
MKTSSESLRILLSPPSFPWTSTAVFSGGQLLQDPSPWNASRDCHLLPPLPQVPHRTHRQLDSATCRFRSTLPHRTSRRGRLDSQRFCPMGQEPLRGVREEEELPARSLRNQDRFHRLRERIQAPGGDVRLGQGQPRKHPRYIVKNNGKNKPKTNCMELIQEASISTTERSLSTKC